MISLGGGGGVTDIVMICPEGCVGNTISVLGGPRKCSSKGGVSLLIAHY